MSWIWIKCVSIGPVAISIDAVVHEGPVTSTLMRANCSRLAMHDFTIINIVEKLGTFGDSCR